MSNKKKSTKQEREDRLFEFKDRCSVVHGNLDSYAESMHHRVKTLRPNSSLKLVITEDDSAKAAVAELRELNKNALSGQALLDYKNWE